MLRSLYSRHLYVRIWLAVVAGVVILTLMANWICLLYTSDAADE